MSKIYHYKECGLDNVFIEGINICIDDDGDEVITISAVNELHKAIALGIVSHEHGISGEELRFLRTEMGYTQAELAIFVHNDKQTIGRWERGEYDIDGSAETIIRRLAIEKLTLDVELDMEELARRSISTVPMQRIEIKKSSNNEHYELSAA